MTPVQSDDAGMMEAIHQARASLSAFFSALTGPKPSQTSFLVKIGVDDGPDHEHLWFADLDFSKETPTGVVANEPATKKLKFMQRVPIDFRYLSDWMYVDDGRLVGGYTTRLLIGRLPPEQRPAAIAALSYRLE